MKATFIYIARAVAMIECLQSENGITIEQPNPQSKGGALAKFGAEWPAAQRSQRLDFRRNRTNENQQSLRELVVQTNPGIEKHRSIHWPNP